MFAAEPTTTRPDPELAALPGPRRPWRRATLVSLSLTLVASAVLCVALWSQLLYAFEGGQPAEVGDLAQLQPNTGLANTWVHGTGALEMQAVGYRRPLESDRFRLARVRGNLRLWVELREPAGSRGEHFLPPSSFVGRLLPLSQPGLRHSGILEALANSGQDGPSREDWLLIDGESPSTTRWVLGVWALLLAFVGFSGFGIYRLLKPIRAD